MARRTKTGKIRLADEFRVVSTARAPGVRGLCVSYRGTPRAIESAVPPPAVLLFVMVGNKLTA